MNELEFAVKIIERILWKCEILAVIENLEYEQLFHRELIMIEELKRKIEKWEH